MTINHQPMLIANTASEALAKKIAAEMGIPFSKMIKKQFADGEHYHAFPEDVAGRNIIIIGATHSDASHQELLDLLAGCRYWNANSINVVIPYLGYSTMERAKPFSGEIPKGVTRTRQIFRVRPDYVAFVDLHSEAVLHAHSGEIRTRHLWTDDLVVEKINKCGFNNFVLVSPDYGFSKRVARLAGLLDCPHTAANKDRYDTDKTIVGQLSSAVKGKTAIICDDMIRTGGTILQTASRCLEAGAVDIMVLATHLVLAGNIEKQFKTQGIRRIIGSDTYPGREGDDFLEIYSVAPMIAGVLARYLAYETGK